MRNVRQAAASTIREQISTSLEWSSRDFDIRSAADHSGQLSHRPAPAHRRLARVTGSIYRACP
jgi:hypothetical protein